jgi:hypothetical protein
MERYFQEYRALSHWSTEQLLFDFILLTLARHRKILSPISPSGSAMKEQGSDAQAPQENLKQSETQQSHFNLMTTEIQYNNMFACPMIWMFQRSRLILKVILMIYHLPTQWRFSSAHQNIPKFKARLI